MEEHLLSGRNEKGKLSSYEYLERSNSIQKVNLSGRPEVTIEEIRSAAAFSDIYPPSVHAALITFPDSDPREQDITFHNGLQFDGNGHNGSRREVLDEVEIRELLIDHVGHRYCWGSHPARTWKISAVEDCNVYVGTLETFIEERDMIREINPYPGGQIDGNDNDVEFGIWELDLRSEFPHLFIPHKQARMKIPHSESLVKCSDCKGRGENVCSLCNGDEEESGYYKKNQTSQCLTCHGRGLVARRDGSDAICVNCSGKGKVMCPTCGSRGLLKCRICDGQGRLLINKTAIIKWSTLSTRKVSASSGAASVPDEVFHRAKGEQLCNTQAYQCTPAFFADSYHLNKFSSDVISDRPLVPPTARIICERHIISVVPVTRVVMTHRNRIFGFYIIGLSREVYVSGYPSKFCWGVCSCLDWLQLW